LYASFFFGALRLCTGGFFSVEDFAGVFSAVVVSSLFFSLYFYGGVIFYLLMPLEAKSFFTVFIYF